MVTLGFTDHVALAVCGTLAWGAAIGIQESTLKATVAGLFAAGHSATAYSTHAAVAGEATFAGSTLTGVLYEHSVPALIAAVLIVQIAALVLLGLMGVHHHRSFARRP